MLHQLAFAIVTIAGLFLIVFGSIAIWCPLQASRFLLGFAKTFSKHYLELFIRLVIGAAFVISAQHLSSTIVFQAIGWTLLITTTCILLLPWRLHQYFAEQAVPKVLRFLSAIGLISIVTGTLILVSLYTGRIS